MFFLKWEFIFTGYGPLKTFLDEMFHFCQSKMVHRCLPATFTLVSFLHSLIWNCTIVLHSDVWTSRWMLWIHFLCFIFRPSRLWPISIAMPSAGQTNSFQLQLPFWRRWFMALFSYQRLPTPINQWVPARMICTSSTCQVELLRRAFLRHAPRQRLPGPWGILVSLIHTPSPRIYSQCC